MCPRDTINHRRTRYYHRKHGTSQRDNENEEEEEANRAKDDDRLLLNRHLLDGFLRLPRAECSSAVLQMFTLGPLSLAGNILTVPYTQKCSDSVLTAF